MVVDGKSSASEASPGAACPDNMATIVRLLNRHEFGENPDGQIPTVTADEIERHPFHEIVRLRVLASQADRLKRLHSYLQSIFHVSIAQI